MKYIDLLKYIINIIEISNDRPIEDLVKDVCINSNRNIDKANEWIQRLKGQDIMTVGDLRECNYK